MIEHKAPAPFPRSHFIGIEIPADLASVIQEAAAKNGVLFSDQLLSFAQAGAECARLHEGKSLNPRKKK